VLRYGWVWVSMQLTLLRARRHDDAAVSPPRRIIAAMSAAGARGAITLAGALTLPLTLNDGTPFPARDLVIFLASGVILSSLVIAAVALPLLLRGLNLPPDEGIAAARDRARLVSAKAAIAELDRVQHQMADGRDDPDRFTDIAARLMDQYRERIDSLATLPEDRTGQADAPIERDMRLAAVRAERNAIFDLARRREIGVTLAEQLGRELDLIDARLSRQGLA